VSLLQDLSNLCIEEPRNVASKRKLNLKQNVVRDFAATNAPMSKLDPAKRAPVPFCQPLEEDRDQVNHGLDENQGCRSRTKIDHDLRTALMAFKDVLGLAGMYQGIAFVCDRPLRRNERVDSSPSAGPAMEATATPGIGQQLQDGKALLVSSLSEKGSRSCDTASA
jgi:hypothetical protein